MTTTIVYVKHKFMGKNHTHTHTYYFTYYILYYTVHNIFFLIMVL